MTAPTPEELAAVLAALASRRAAAAVAPYEQWRRERLRALRTAPRR